MKKILKSTIFLLISAILFCGFLFINGNRNTSIAHAEEQKIYLGGTPIGIHAASEEFIVTDFVNVITPSGSFSPAQKAGVKKGDIILSVNDRKPKDVNELLRLIQEKEISDFTIKRNKEVISIPVKAMEDVRNNGKRAGIMIKNDINGIGTLTYVQENGTFGALGHPIGDEYGNSDMYQNGTIYDCTIYGYKRAEKDKAGELIGQFNALKPIGTFYSNTLSGILGKLDKLPKEGTPIELGKKENVIPGKAKIYTTIDGKTPKLYDIEIIKAQNQPTEKEKSMVIRVTDEALLKTTGGILQGMSGSPIIQNNRLIGAVTHVLTSDSTLGYGIYIEWMMN